MLIEILWRAGSIGVATDRARTRLANGCAASTFERSIQTCGLWIPGNMPSGQNRRPTHPELRYASMPFCFEMIANHLRLRHCSRRCRPRLDREMPVCDSLRLSDAASSDSLRTRSSRTRFTRRRDASSTVTRTESCQVIDSPTAGTRPNSANTKPPIVSKSSFSGRSKPSAR